MQQLILFPAFLAAIAGLSACTGANFPDKLPDAHSGDAAQDGTITGDFTEEGLALTAAAQPTAVVKAALEAVVPGLLYTSESDYPFQILVLPSASKPMTTKLNIQNKLAPVYVLRPETMPLAQRSVETLTLAALFKNYIHRQDWWEDNNRADQPKFQKLYDILRFQLAHVHVYRVGPKTPWGLQPDIDIFIEGTTADGDLIVLWTVSIET